MPTAWRGHGNSVKHGHSEQWPWHPRDLLCELCVLCGEKGRKRRSARWPKIADSIYLYTCYSDAMIQTRTPTKPENKKIQQVEAALAKLLADSSQRGFFGEAVLTLS